MLVFSVSVSESCIQWDLDVIRNSRVCNGMSLEMV